MRQGTADWGSISVTILCLHTCRHKNACADGDFEVVSWASSGDSADSGDRGGLRGCASSDGIVGSGIDAGPACYVSLDGCATSNGGD